MNKNKLKEMIREIVDRVLDENAPAPSKPKPSPGPAVAPGKPDTGKPKPRRPLGNPEVKPAPKAGLKEEEMLKKIVARFKSKKGMDEMLSLGNLKSSDKKATPRYTDAEIDAMSVKQAADAFKKMWDVPHNTDVIAKLKKKLKDAEKAKNKK
jgi:hypothetical protein